MKRTSKHRKAPWTDFRDPVRTAKVKRAAELREYGRRRKKFLAAHKTCGVCVTARSASVHHKIGRRNERLLNEKFWLAVCDVCHDRIHRVLPEFPEASGPAWAKANGFLGSFHT